MENLGLFEKYHDGSMTESEKTEFLQHLSNDPILEQEFKIYNEVNNFIINDEKRSAFISTLKEVEKEYFNEGNKTSVKNNKLIFHNLFFKVAASVAIIVVSALCVYYIFISKPSNKELFAQYYHPLTVDEITRSVNDSATTLKEGFIAYQKGNYKHCIQILTSDSIPYELNTHITLIKGLSYLELGNYANATNFLKQASVDVNNAYHDDCLWYLSLVYIKIDQSATSIPLLNKLIERKSVYCKQATEILESME